MHSRVALFSAVAMSLVALGWWFILPASLGGRATYVVTHGVSMQPRFHTGDLAIIYPASGYPVGEIAAYHSDLLHTVVLHRIVGKSADGYVFKGDNNSWLDPEHPGQEQVVGRLGLRLPYGGVVLGGLRNPLTVGLLAAAITIAGATSATGNGLRRRRRRHARAGRTPHRTPMGLHFLHATAPARWPRAAAAGTVALLCMGVAGATYLLPGHDTQAQKVPWTTQVTYAYSAATSRNVIYPDGEVHPGQTVFRKLVDRLAVRATWSLRTQASHHIEGTARLEAIIHGPAGWTHPVKLGSVREITGDRVTVSGTLDLAALDAVVSRAGDLTGVPTDHYTVSMRPLVELSGSLAGVPLQYSSARPEAALTLAVTPGTVAPAAGPSTGEEATVNAQSSTGDPGSAASSSKWLTPDATTNSTTVSTPGTAAWHLLGHRVPVAAVRWASLSGTALAVLALAVLLTAKPGRNDPCVREAHRHRGSIISVSGLRIGRASNILEVSSMKALAQVAQRYDRLILQETSTPGVYLVEDETGLYRYQCTHRGPDLRLHLAGPQHATPVSESAESA